MVYLCIYFMDVLYVSTGEKDKSEFELTKDTP